MLKHAYHPIGNQYSETRCNKSSCTIKSTGTSAVFFSFCSNKHVNNKHNIISSINSLTNDYTKCSTVIFGAAYLPKIT